MGNTEIIDMFIIYISGIDGCGKTTQSKLLVDVLAKKGFDVEYLWLRWEPSIQKAIGLIRSLIRRKRATKEDMNVTQIEDMEQSNWLSFKRRLLLNPFIRQLWWAYACIDYYTVSHKQIRNLNGKIIVVDRYVDDFVIDQAWNFGLLPENSSRLTANLFLKRFRTADLKIIIDLPAIEGYVRKGDGTPLQYLRNREPYYESIPTSENTIHLNGLKDADSLSKEITDWVSLKLEEVP